MALGNNIFPLADQLRLDGRNYLIIHNEIRSIENAILYAADNSLLDAIVYNSYMTNITFESFQDVTSVDISLDQFTKNSHELQSGDEIQLVSTGVLPAPLLATRTYFALGVDENTFQICDSFLDAVNSNPINITTVGTGTHSFRKLTPAQKYYQTWQGSRLDRAQIDQMNVVLKYFTDLGYSIKRQTNPNTGVTFWWSLSW